MILEPGIFIITITLDLAQFKSIKISALIVITQDRAATPVGMTSTIFVLKPVPQCDKFQSPRWRDLGSKFDIARALTGAAPYDLTGGALDRKKQIWRRGK